MKINAIETAEFVKKHRAIRGVTQAVFAEMINKTRDDIASYETGRAVPPGYVILRILDLPYILEIPKTSAGRTPANAADPKAAD